MATMAEIEHLAAAVARRLIERGETVAVAESAAGGLISAALLGVAGASAYYKGGAVVYTGDGIRALTGLTREDTAPHRAATVPFSALLAEAVRLRLGADWAIAETGAAGPAGNRYGDPPGHAALAVAGPVTAAMVVETGESDRRRNMEAFALAALRLLHETLMAG